MNFTLTRPILCSKCCCTFSNFMSYLLGQVDVHGYRWLTSLLEWMGKHSLSIFVLVTSNVAVIALQGFYWKVPENNIVSDNNYFLLHSGHTIYIVCSCILTCGEVKFAVADKVY